MHERLLSGFNKALSIGKEALKAGKEVITIGAEAAAIGSLLLLMKIVNPFMINFLKS